MVDFAVGYIAIMAVVGAAQVAVTRRFAHIALGAARRLWRPLVRTALPLGLAAILVTVYYRIDSVLLINMRGAEEAGLYGTVYRVLEPLAFLPAAVMTSLFPVISALHGRDPARVARLAQVALDFMAIISLPLLGGAIAVGAPVIETLFGADFARAGGLLPILMLAFVSICYGHVAGFLVPVVGLGWRYAAFAAAGVALNVPLNLALIPPYGAYGSAWATVATEITVLALTLTAVLRRLPLRPEAGRILRAGVAAALMTAAMVVAERAGLAAAVIAGIVTYPVALVALRAVDRRELMALVRPEAAR